MAEGTYGSSPFYQNNMSSDPNAPASQFTTNVNRKKTRKWVEAKKINYDGSGWGDEDDDDDEYDDEDEPVPSMPAMPPPHQAVAGTRNLPSMAAARSASFPVSLSSGGPQGESHSALPSREGPTPIRAATASNSSPLAGPGTPSGSPFPSAAGGGQRPWADGRSASPLGPRSQSPATPGGGRRGHFIRPSDIYKRVGSSDDVRSGSTDRHPAAAARERLASGTVAPSEQRPIAPGGEISRTVDSPSPDVFHDFPTPTTNTTEDPFSQQASGFRPPTQPQTQTQAPAPAPAPAPTQPQMQATLLPPVQHKQQDSVNSVASSTESGVSKDAADHASANRYSSSPKLPDLARFSTFSPDILFGDGFLSSDAPPMPSLPAPTTGAPAKISEENEVAEKEHTPGAATSAAAGIAGIAGVAGVAGAVAGAAGSTSDDSEGVKLPDHLNLKHPKDSFSSASESQSLAATRDSTATATTAATMSSMSDETAGPSSQPRSGRTSEDKEARRDVDPTKTLADDSYDARYSTPPPIAAAPLANVPTTAPLNPHRSDINLQDVTIPTITTSRERTGTVSTITGSPAKESDKLREEIIRTLSPVKMTSSAESESAENPDRTTPTASTSGVDAGGVAGDRSSQRKSDHARTLTAESSYLESVYGDYWSPDDANPAAENQPDQAKSAAIAAVGATQHDSPTSVVAPLSTSPKATSSIGSRSGSTGVAAGAAVAAAMAASAAAVAASKSSGSAKSDQRQMSPTSSHSAGFSSAAAAVSPQPKEAAAPRAKHNLRRRFSWEVEPEEPEEPEESLPTAPVSVPAPAPLATASSPTRDIVSPTSDSHPMSATDATNLVSPTSMSTAAYGSGGAPTVSSPSPDSDHVAEADNTAAARQSTESKSSSNVSHHTALEEAPKPAAPVLRSMLDVGDDEPTTPSAANSEPAVQRQRTMTLDSVASEAVPAPGLDSPSTATHSAKPSTSTSVNVVPDVTGQYLTLRQCMAFSTHEERMEKLAETRRQFAAADSGIGAWLSSMTAVPEYSRAASTPLWEGNVANAPVSRPVALAPHVNVNIPSSAQITHKSKEILHATGKAGKGLLALRKKTFHKKATN